MSREKKEGNSMILTDKTIGVLMGGTSSERDVSLRSGTAILKALLNLGYNAKGIDVGADICQMIQKNNVEIAFIALHGGSGEDGSIQGLLEVLGIPYTGSGVLASALGMDKLASKLMFKSYGIPTPEFETLTEIKKPFMKYPIVLKPQKEGSSIGVSIVKNNDKFDEAIKHALSFNGVALVEEYVEGKEVQIGILNDNVLGGVEVVPQSEFYSYEDKYKEGRTEYFLPPRLDKQTYEWTKEIAFSASKAIGAEGATRVDLIVDNKSQIFVLEVNTVPGMTETSLLPKIAGYAGMEFPQLVEEILGSALSKIVT